MGRNELGLWKCKENHLGKTVRSTDSKWEELSNNMKSTVKASIVLTFTVAFKKFGGINILVITILAVIFLKWITGQFLNWFL